MPFALPPKTVHAILATPAPAPSSSSALLHVTSSPRLEAAILAAPAPPPRERAPLSPPPKETPVMAAKVIPMFSTQTAQRVLHSSLGTGAGAPRPSFAGTLATFGGGGASTSGPSGGGGGAMVVDDGAGASSAPGDAPSGGVLAQAKAFVAENKTAVAIAGGVGVLAVSVGLYLAFRKG